MEHLKKEEQCRVCLEVGADIPIFAEIDENNVRLKFQTCTKEMISIDDGYPTYICSMCLDMLNVAYDFVEKYKISCKYLQNQWCYNDEEALKLKDEEPLNKKPKHIVSDDDHNAADVFYEPIKAEFDQNGNSDLDDLRLDDIPLLFLSKKTKHKIKKKKHITYNDTGRHKEKRKAKLERDRVPKSNAIASSLLEGVFQWNDDNWCSTNTEITISHAVQKKGFMTNLKTMKEKIKRENKDIKKKMKLELEAKTTYLCHLCGLVFKTRSYLQKHNRIHRTLEKMTCPHCPKTFHSQHNMDKHCKRVHEKRKDYTCPECGKQYAFKNELTHHIKSHNRELYPKKMYTCKFCPQKYKTQKSVEIHERSAHTGERPSICSVCGSGFFHDDYLKEHMRLHTGETPFKCPICGRGYAQRGNMKSHLRIHRLAELDEPTRLTMKPNYLKLLRL